MHIAVQDVKDRAVELAPLKDSRIGELTAKFDIVFEFIAGVEGAGRS
jgi:hypothetical protein